jgi:hypothetical protein
MLEDGSMAIPEELLEQGRYKELWYLAAWGRDGMGS